MRLVILTAAASVAAATALPALAGGLSQPVAEQPVLAPAPAATRVDGDWTGFWGGASLGYGDLGAGGAGGNGMLYGLRAGYDRDFGGWVLGGGLDYDWSDAKLGGGAGKLDSIARLKLRAGADLGRTLVYATGGVAQAKATVAGASGTDSGYFGGVGLDYKVTDSMTVGAELLSNRFDNFKGTGTDLDATTASLTVGFRF